MMLVDVHPKGLTPMIRIENRSLARIAVSFSAAALVALGTALPSLAAPTQGTSGGAASATNLAVTGAPLTGGAIAFADFGVNGTGVVLNGRQQTPTASFSFTDLVDASGAGTGWHLSLTLTPFVATAPAAAVTAGYALAPSSLTVRHAPIISLMDPTGSDPANIVPGLTVMTPLDNSPATAVKLFQAPVGEGMGAYSISPVDLALNVPANTYAATYTSTATVTLVNAP
jgi:hypothetical protein